MWLQIIKLTDIWSGAILGIAGVQISRAIWGSILWKWYRGKIYIPNVTEHVRIWWPILLMIRLHKKIIGYLPTLIFLPVFDVFIDWKKEPTVVDSVWSPLETRQSC